MSQLGEADGVAARMRARCLSLSDDSFFDSSSGSLPNLAPEGLPENPKVRLRYPSSSHLERQRSVEYLDLDIDDHAGLPSSTPDLRGSGVSDVKKVKKKRHFRVFHRHHHKSKRKNELDSRLADSLPPATVSTSNGHGLVPSGSTHLSLESTWSHGSWRQLDPDMRTSSAHSSSNSMLSVGESEDGRELTDEELVEMLVTPRGSIRPSIAPPLEVGRSVSLAESEAGVSLMAYTVSITLMSGHGLAIRDRTGTSDPYVKFKCPPFKYRSAVIHRNLNPEWKEHFSFRTHNLHAPMSVRVFDHDYGSLDDFMGGQTVDMSSYALEEQHIVDLGLVDPAAPKNENLGFIRLFIKISLASAAEVAAASREKQKSPGSKLWTSVLTVTLLEGNNLPAMDQNGLSDPYCKFKLGTQKYKSKAQSKTLNPKWMQRFDLRMYDDCSILHVEVWDKDFPQNDDFIGMCSVDLLTLPRDVTHNFTLPLLTKDNEPRGEDCCIHFSLCITGNQMEDGGKTGEGGKMLEDGCAKSQHKYGLLRSLDLKAIKQRNIGHLCLTIDKVVDIVACSCFVLVELGNSCVKTQTVSKTANPEWNKNFEFVVGDIHDELDISVYKAGSRSDQLLGRIKIPLHRLGEGPLQFSLKDKHCLARSRGVLHINTSLVYNPVRAMIRTVNPREHKHLEAEQKFKKRVLMDNIKRVSNLSRTILSTVEFIESTWSWENKALSCFSLLVFLVVTLFGELWIAMLVGAIVFMYQYLVVFIKKDHIWQNKVSTNVHIISNLTRSASIDVDDSDFSDHIEDKHTSLRDKFKQFQEILVLVQTILGYVADAEEGVKNLLNWRVPFLSWMAILVFLGGTVLFYLVPIRYVILVWGINKYTKRLRTPNYISNNELLDFLSRCPTNKQLQQWQEFPLALYHRPPPNTKSHKKSIRKTK